MLKIYVDRVALRSAIEVSVVLPYAAMKPQILIFHFFSVFRFQVCLQEDHFETMKFVKMILPLPKELDPKMRMALPLLLLLHREDLNNA